ncbi:hypothetical protein UlMin_005741 [Ulmus minor]
MALPLRALLGLLLLLVLVLSDYVNANLHLRNGQRVAHHHHTGRGQRGHGKLALHLKHHRPKFKPGPWTHAHATFYEGGSGTFGGACGYDDVVKEGYGLQTVALSEALFNKGEACGACYEIKCVDDPQWCKPGQPSLIVTGTNHCPPNYYQSSENGGWCNPPLHHFDIAKPVFLNVAEYKAGIIPIIYRRIPCRKLGGIRFTISGNPYFNEVLVWNVGGAGDVVGVQVKGSKKLKWTPMNRMWGQKWVTNAMMVGESLTFRVRASDGRFSTAWHVAPKTWQFGQTFEGKNFK